MSAYARNRRLEEAAQLGIEQPVHYSHSSRRAGAEAPPAPPSPPPSPSDSENVAGAVSGSGDVVVTTVQQAKREVSELTRARKYREVVEVFKKIKFEDADAGLCCAVLSACAKGLMANEAFEIWNRMSQEQRTVPCYCAILDVCKRLKRSRNAEGLWREMLSRDLKPTAIAYNTMISTHAGVGNVLEAASLFEEAKKTVLQGANAAVRATSYVAVMSAFSRQGDYARTREYFVQMVEEGLTPGHLHFNSLMASCARDADAATAQAIFDLLPSYSLKPRLEDYMILMGCCRNDIKKFTEVFETYKQEGFPITSMVREHALTAHVLAGDRAAAQAIIDGSMGVLDTGPQKVQTLIATVQTMPAPAQASQ